MAEEARLESVYTPKAYREFESRSLRPNTLTITKLACFFLRDISPDSLKKSPTFTIFAD